MVQVAFYAPLKSPDHPVPSGDRTVARHLITALEMAGHKVDLASQLRSRTPDPTPANIETLTRQAHAEITRLRRQWQSGPPDIWFTYHLYYKAPDLIGPVLCREFGIPYVVAEASHSQRRMSGQFRPLAECALAAIRQADAVLYVTRQDRQGLLPVTDLQRLHHLPPFTLTRPGPPPLVRHGGHPLRMLAVGMMRPGDKTRSYQMLANALRYCTAQNWQLDIIGDGENRRLIQGFFTPFGDQVSFLGQLPPEHLNRIFNAYDVQVWPAINEAYGMTLLDGLMTGLPVIAGAEGGVPDIVHHTENGLLSTPRRADLLGRNIAILVRNHLLQNRLSIQAWRQTRNRHSVAHTATTLGRLTSELCRSS